MGRSERLRALVRRTRAFRKQVGWSVGARLISALLQMAVVVLLARGLAPERFAFVTTAMVVLQAISVVNGFGLQRQIQLLRSRGEPDERLEAHYVMRLYFTYASSGGWLLICLGLAVWSGETFFVQLLPCAVWLAIEQTTNIWNAVSTVDHRNEALMPSLILRRLPVALALATALALNWDVVWTWSLSLAAGSIAAYVHGVRSQEPWARVLVPRRRTLRHRVKLDLTFWWASLGGQLRDLDVGSVAMVDPHTAGIYSFPARLLRPMNMLTQSISSVAFPNVARKNRVGGRELSRGILIGTIPVGLMSACLALLAPAAPFLLGRDYSHAVVAIQVLSLAAALMGANMLLWLYLQTRSSVNATIGGYLILLLGIAQVAAAPYAAIAMGPVGPAWNAVGVQAAMLVALGILSARQVRYERGAEAA